MNLTKLKDPFPAKDIEWRVQRSGVKSSNPWAMVLAYVTNRAIMERLDDVCGPQNWKNYFEKAPNDGVLCGIAIKCGDEWVTKWDGASNTDIEAVKGGLSSAMKRAGSQWGIGRYLYNLDTGFAVVSKKGKFSAKVKDGGTDVWFKWDPPGLPEWALPQGEENPVPKKQADKNAVGAASFKAGTIAGWIALGVQAIMDSKKDEKTSAQEWWVKNRQVIISDCGNDGANEVHAKVVK